MILRSFATQAIQCFYYSEVLFLGFQKTGITMAFFQSSGISPFLHDLSQVIESDLEVISVNTHEFILSGFMDLSAQILPVWSLSRSFLIKRKPSFSLISDSLSYLQDLGFQRARLSSKDWIKEGTFSTDSFTRAPTSFSSWLIFSLLFLLLTYIKKKFSCPWLPSPDSIPSKSYPSSSHPCCYIPSKWPDPFFTFHRLFSSIQILLQVSYSFLRISCHLCLISYL